jgi:hypothetical protein
VKHGKENDKKKIWEEKMEELKHRRMRARDIKKEKWTVNEERRIKMDKKVKLSYA